MEKQIELKEITKQEVDFAQWYTDVCLKAELIAYSSVKGCMIIRPYGYAIWENIQNILDKELKKTRHENVYMPLFIPESLLQKEKDHVEGFAPEVAWVTHGGANELEERLCVRPTSETLFCEHYANIVRSYKDLPKLYNQWCSVVRWEKTTRPFLRSREFLWQEGHTVHATAEEAEAETLQMLNIYADFAENCLAIPVIKGQKTDKEKFAGAESTYTFESMMHNGVALQTGTSHYFGNNFSKAFEMQFLNKENKLEYMYQTSWGVSTRLIGAIIMCHGDDKGLVLPPNIAPIKAIIIPIGKDEAVFEKANEILSNLNAQGVTTKIDLSEKSPGYKFAEAEVRGIPLRIEIGPRDLANNVVTVVRRDTGVKTQVEIEKLLDYVLAELKNMQKDMFDRALERRNGMIYVAKDYQEFKNLADTKPGFIKTMWCGDRACEEKIKEEIGVSSRCIPFQQENLGDKCICCGKKAKHMVIWGKQY